MNPELIHALTCYREWRQAFEAEVWTRKRMTDAFEQLLIEDRAEYDKLARTIRADVQQPL